MHNARLLFLFRRYTDQLCTDDEKRELMRLINDSAHNEPVKTLMDQLWQESSPHIGLSSEKRARILDEIFAAGKAVAPVRRKKTPLLWQAAAAALALVVSGIAYYSLQHGDHYSTTAVQTAEAPAAEHKYVKLPDGSTVILNARSELNYSRSFGDKTREVVLSGEGYFDVKHDPARPFIVTSGKLTTTVLGTAFNIKAYPGEGSVTVTVTRGKVEVSNNKKVIGIVTPDQQITFNDGNDNAEQKTVDSKDIIAWQEKDIFFDDVTFAHAAARLEDRFDVTIQFAGSSLKACRFTATFVRAEDLDQVLNVICEFNGATFTNDGSGHIRISGKGC